MLAYGFVDFLQDLVDGITYNVYLKDGDNNYHKLSEFSISDNVFTFKATTAYGGDGKIHCEDGYYTYIEWIKNGEDSIYIDNENTQLEAAF